MIWKIFGASAISVLFVCCTEWLATAQDRRCEMGEMSEEEVSDANFTVKVTNQNDLLVLGVFQSTKAQRTAAARILYDEGADFDDSVRRAMQIFRLNSDTQNVGSNALFLTERLLQGSVDFVMVAVSPDTLSELQVTARNLLMLDMSDRLRFGKKADESVHRLVQLMVGAPVFIKTYEPGLFGNVKLLSAPILEKRSEQANVERAFAKDDRSDNSSKREAARKMKAQLLEDFRRSPRTRRQLERFAERFQSGEFDGESTEAVREKVLARFWRPAQAKIREWVDLELAARNNRESFASNRPIEPASSSPKPSVIAQTLALDLLNEKGRGVIFVSRDDLRALRQEMGKVCVQ